MPEETELKQFTVSEQIAISATDAEDAIKQVIDGKGSVMSITVNVRGAAVARPAPIAAATAARPAGASPVTGIKAGG